MGSESIRADDLYRSAPPGAHLTPDHDASSVLYMTTTYDIPQPFEAVETDHGIWTVQAHTPNGPLEWVLIEVSANCAAATSMATLLNEVVALA